MSAKNPSLCIIACLCNLALILISPPVTQGANYPDWVAYRLDKDTITGNVDTSRKWQTDPCLNDREMSKAPILYQVPEVNVLKVS